MTDEVFILFTVQSDCRGQPGTGGAFVPGGMGARVRVLGGGGGLGRQGGAGGPAPQALCPREPPSLLGSGL